MNHKNILNSNKLVESTGEELESSAAMTSEKEANNNGRAYDPYEHRKVTRPTSNMDTLLHLIKAILGTGILAMPKAFHNAGYVVGTIGTIFVGVVCTYCIHILLKSHYELCKRRRVPNLTFPQIAEASLEEGPKTIRKYSRGIYHVTNVFLLLFVYGTCTIYTIFISKNLKAVGDYYTNSDVDLRIYMSMILLPLILINYIHNLKFLVPCSTVANVLTIVSFCIIGYYIFRDPIKMEGTRKIGSWAEFPLFFGTVLFALEAIYVIMPLENEMKSPKAFVGLTGVLNQAMSILVVLYVAIGLFGYLKYGNEISDSIILNLPQEDGLAQAAKVMLACGIFVTHGLVGYVAIDMTWTEYVPDSIKHHPHKTFWHYVVRTSVVLVTFLLAVAIPNLGTFISLVGSLSLSTLGLVLPAIIESFTYYNYTGGCYRILINSFLILVGIAGLIIGTYMNIREMFM